MNKVLSKKIVLTCGPASENDAILKQMAKAASAFRLNIAHMNIEKLQSWLKKLTLLRDETRRDFEIIIDLQGAKVRIGNIPSCEKLLEPVKLFYGKASEHPSFIPVPSESVFLNSSPGDVLLLNDRKIILEVVSREIFHEGCKGPVIQSLNSEFPLLNVKILQNGPLSSGKGINSPDRIFEFPRIMHSDKIAMEKALEICADNDLAFAISFVSDGREIDLFKPLSQNAKLIAKIEQREAFKNLQGIDSVFDELWLCRGDLGAEVGLSDLGRYQSIFLDHIRSKIKKPALLAGEVLGSTTVLPTPSRAEIVGLYDAMSSGFSGIVLSDETACGKYPEKVVDFLLEFFEMNLDKNYESL